MINDDPLVMYFTVQLLACVELVHVLMYGIRSPLNVAGERRQCGEYDVLLPSTATQIWIVKHTMSEMLSVRAGTGDNAVIQSWYWR